MASFWSCMNDGLDWLDCILDMLRLTVRPILNLNGNNTSYSMSKWIFRIEHPTSTTTARRDCAKCWREDEKNMAVTLNNHASLSPLLQLISSPQNLYKYLSSSARNGTITEAFTVRHQFLFSLRKPTSHSWPRTLPHSSYILQSSLSTSS